MVAQRSILVLLYLVRAESSFPRVVENLVDGKTGIQSGSAYDRRRRSAAPTCPWRQRLQGVSALAGVDLASRNTYHREVSRCHQRWTETKKVHVSNEGSKRSERETLRRHRSERTL